MDCLLKITTQNCTLLLNVNFPDVKSFHDFLLSSFIGVKAQAHFRLKFGPRKQLLLKTYIAWKTIEVEMFLEIEILANISGAITLQSLQKISQNQSSVDFNPLNVIVALI